MWEEIVYKGFWMGKRLDSVEGERCGFVDIVIEIIG